MIRAHRAITICGAGTLGGHLAEHLARLGFPSLTVIDREAVDADNLANQPYATPDVGQVKVKALAAALYRAVGTRVVGQHRTLGSGNAERLLADAEIVVDAFDNHASRQAVQDACRKLGRACLHVGLSNDGYGEVAWDGSYHAPADTPDPACRRRASRTLALMVALLAAEAVVGWLDEGRQRGFTVTAADMAVREIP